MDLPGIIKAVLTSRSDSAQKALSGLQVGARLVARVLTIENDGRVMLELGGSRLSAQVDVAVKPGDQLDVQVVKNGPVIHLRTGSQDGTAKAPATIRAVPVPETAPSGPAMARFKPGQMVTAKVIQLQEQGRALVDLDGTRVSAQLDIPARAGQTLKLQVVQTGPVLHLQVQASQQGSGTPVMAQLDLAHALAPADKDGLIRLIDQLTIPRSGADDPRQALSESLQRAFLQIRSAFDPLPLERSTEEVGRWIKNAVEERGLLFEKRLADAATETAQPRHQAREVHPGQLPSVRIFSRDLKSQLMMVRDHLAHMSEHDPVAQKLDTQQTHMLRSHLDRMLGHIEAQQDNAVSRWADGQMHQVFVHMLPLPHQDRPVQLKMYYPRKRGKTGPDQPHRIAMLLDMDRLGAVRVDLAMAGRQLQIHFFVQHQRVKRLMEPQIEEVQAALAGHFDYVGIDVRVSEEKIRRFEHEASDTAARGRIDLTV